jgi:hypothetical protein
MSRIGVLTPARGSRPPWHPGNSAPDELGDVRLMEEVGVTVGGLVKRALVEVPLGREGCTL